MKFILRKSAFKMGRQLACILVALFVVHVQADFGIPGYSFRNINKESNHTFDQDFVVDGDGNVIHDKKIVDAIDEPCDLEVCEVAIAKTERPEETLISKNPKTVGNAGQDDTPGVIAVVEKLDEFEREPSNSHERGDKKSKSQSDNLYTRKEAFNYKYKEITDYCEFRNRLNPLDAKYITERMTLYRTRFVGRRDRVLQTLITKWAFGVQIIYVGICPIDHTGDCTSAPKKLDPNFTGNEVVSNIMGKKAKVMVTMFAPEHNRKVNAICVLNASKGGKVNFNKAAKTAQH